MKASAKSPANMAFIKYWGKKDSKLNLPNSDTLSVNLSNLYSTTTVEFSDKYQSDEIVIDGETISKEVDRTVKFLDNIRLLAKFNLKAKVVSNNNFPKSSGLASSASGFSALALAGTAAAGLKLSEKKLSILARLGAGSACRSLPDGFVEWREGTNSEDSYAYSIYPPSYWKISALAVIVSLDKKKYGSLEGHALAGTSPFYKIRLANMKNKIKAFKQALKDKDFEKFGDIVEAEALELHSIALTSSPSIIYWEPVTIKVMKEIQDLRESGILSYFTMDAGPQPVVFCQDKDTQKVKKTLTKIPGVIKIIINKPAVGARLQKKHLF